ncbi:MAG: winged helix-turn-helix transcriptional regulator [Gemmatimonadota bacterium]
MTAPGAGRSQRDILLRLKRRGRLSIPELAAALGLNIETLRGHLKALVAEKLVLRVGTRSAGGPGRPEVLYGLAPEAEALFPRREAEILRELAAHLVKSGRVDVIREFFERRVGARRTEARRRVRLLKGRARVREVARIFSELGFMAVMEADDGALRLRLCHCPLRELVRATRIPCAAEISLIQELLGDGLHRTSYIPAGDDACSYRVEA